VAIAAFGVTVAGRASPEPASCLGHSATINYRGRAVMGRRTNKQILRDLDKARKGLFPHKTCPASRHVHLIVEGMMDRKSPLSRELAGFEPEHMASSIASVLESLWKARRWMRWQPNIVGDYMAGGEWVPDLDAIAAATGTAKTPKAVECEASQSGLKGIAHPSPSPIGKDKP
jgi:hypothetical protein